MYDLTAIIVVPLSFLQLNNCATSQYCEVL